MKGKKLKRNKYSRDDGWLAELVSSEHNDVSFNGIHSYLVVIKPNRHRAMHYHKLKEEWLAITAGKIKVVLEDIKTKEQKEIIFDEDAVEFNLLYIPPKIAHVVKNVGEKNASLVVFSKKGEIPNDTIDYEVEV